MVDRFQRAALATRLHIPLLYGIDSVHGDGNMYGATVFPHNIGLGATRDPALVRAVAHVTAEETRASGPQWTFAPCICVGAGRPLGPHVRELRRERPRWSRRWRPRSTASRAATWPADATACWRRPSTTPATATRSTAPASGDYTIDQGVAITSRQDFWEGRCASTCRRCASTTSASVMPSFSSVDWTEDGVGNPIKMHANQELITGVLKGRMGFDGFVISDWEGIHQIPGDWPTQVRTGVNAGIDMMMEPNAYQSFITTLLAEVNAGRVPMGRIDDAVRRILTKKFELGLFEHPFTDRRQPGRGRLAPRTTRSPAGRPPSRRCC